MTHFRMSEAARIIGVSDDTIRRWAAEGLLDASDDEAGRRVVSGASLARRAIELAPNGAAEGRAASSARNRFSGIVTGVTRDGLVAQVELQSGPNRIVSLMTSEGIDDLGIEVGSRATAIIKATMVIIEAERS